MSASSPSVPAAATALQGLRLLVVDDSDINLLLARRLLERHGARVETAGDGLSALAMLDRLAQARAVPDLVLMDVQMPGNIDGVEATRQLRLDPRLHRLPVIALTAGTATLDGDALLESAGMDDVVAKPFDPQALVELIRDHVDRARQAASQSPVRLVPPAPDATPWPVIDGIDIDEARLRLSDDPELFLRLLHRMLDEFAGPGWEAIAEPDGDAQARAEAAARLHKLRGSAGLVGASAVVWTATRLETALRAGDVPTAREAAVLLSHVLDMLRDAAGRLPRKPARDTEAVHADARTDTATGIDDDAFHAELAGLDGQLARADLAAIHALDRLAPALRRRWDERALGALRHEIENLDFPAARLRIAGATGLRPAA